MMRIKKRKLLVFLSLTISLLLFIYLVDYKKPKKLYNFWLRHPQLDRLYFLTKFTDFFDPSWFFYPAPPYCRYFLRLMPEAKVLKRWCGVYKTKLPSYELKITRQEWQKMTQSLPPAYSFNFYLRKDYYWAPAKFIYKDKEYEVKVRFRGDLYHHWSGKKKSYRVEFTDDFQDFPELNFIIPEDRGFFAENLANFRAKKLGLIHLESWFGTLKINGRNQGVYLIQEHWNKEFLERHQKSALGGLYGEQDLEEGFYWPQLFSGITAWKKYNKTRGVKENYFDLDYFLDLVNRKTSDEEFKEKIFTVLDKENFFNWQIHSMLSSSYHQDWGHNLRLFFNQVKGKFEFIPFDLETHFDYKKEGETCPIDLDYNPLVTRVLLIPEFRQERDRLLYEQVKEDKNLKEDLEYWDDLFGKLKLEIFKDRQKALSNRFFLNQVKKNSEHFKNHFYNIRKLLEYNDLKIEILQVGENKLKIKIINGASSSVKIQELIFLDNERKEILKKETELEVISGREVEPREEGELYGLIKVVPYTEEVLIEINPEMREKIDFSKTKVKALNLVSQEEIRKEEIKSESLL